MKYVSIILPTYNRDYCIERAINSVVQQTYPYWELLVVDDGSMDHTEEIVMQISQTERRVQYYRQSRNKGVAAARNEGIRRVRYEYIAFQDSDDVWKKDKLEKQMRMFEEQPELGMIYCAYEGTKRDGTVIRVPFGATSIEELQGRMYRSLLQQNVIGAPTVIVRRECLDKSGVFDDNLTCLEDWELFLRISKEYEIGCVNEALVIADIHEGGVSSGVGGYFYTRCKMITNHKKALMEYGLFEKTVEQMLMMAQEAGVLEQVAQMLQSMLTR